MELLNFSNEDVFDKIVMLHAAKYLSFCSFCIYCICYDAMQNYVFLN